MTVSKRSTLVKCVLFGLTVFCATTCHADTGDSQNKKPVTLTQADNEGLSANVRHIWAWVIDSGNNGGMPFVILDKTEARVYVFQADGRLRGAAPALIGLAVGDHSVPGIGERKLSAILPQERTTPAGRFVASLDRNIQNKEILWVDYDSAISLHPVITSNTKERRAQRLATATPDDNRISYGCINVPAVFFQNIIQPAFAGVNGIVYILPETRPVMPFFGAYPVATPDR